MTYPLHLTSLSDSKYFYYLVFIDPKVDILQIFFVAQHSKRTQLWVKTSTVFSFMLLSHTAFIFLRDLSSHEIARLNGVERASAGEK